LTRRNGITIYFTLFRELIPSKAAFISSILANNAFTYSLTLVDYTNTLKEPILDSTSEFSSYILKVTLYYSKEVFIGIIVNIDVSIKSTARYS
jgi:hypothetical protein